MTEPRSPSPRTTLKRGAHRAVYDTHEIREILATGVIAHVGVATDDGPIVLPMAYGIGADEVLLHGSVANAMLRAGRDIDVCITVTIVDGLVVARTPFHNSMNYRSVVVRGVATRVDEPDALVAALRVINDHITELWDHGRPPSEVELAKTLVLSVPLTEASAKVRSGDPIDDESDLDGPHWAGVVPLTSTWGAPVESTNLVRDIAPPPSVEDLTDRSVG